MAADDAHREAMRKLVGAMWPECDRDALTFLADELESRSESADAADANAPDGYWRGVSSGYRNAAAMLRRGPAAPVGPDGEGAAGRGRRLNAVPDRFGAPVSKGTRVHEYRTGDRYEVIGITGEDGGYRTARLVDESGRETTRDFEDLTVSYPRPDADGKLLRIGDVVHVIDFAFEAKRVDGYDRFGRIVLDDGSVVDPSDVVRDLRKVAETPPDERVEEALKCVADVELEAETGDMLGENHKERVCGDCRHFDPAWDDDGQCRRYPPFVPAAAIGGGYEYTHGIVATDFPVCNCCDPACGEFSERV